MSDLLPAIRALAAFDPPKELPPCDLDALGRVLIAHGLAAQASYHIEHTRLAIGLPDAFRESLLAIFQGTVNDNVLRLVTLRNVLKDAPDVPVVLLDGAAYVDWLYPHMAWRPVSDLRLAVRGRDGAAFAAAVAGGLTLERTEHDGRVAVFSDGHLELALQEGLWPGAVEDEALYARAASYRAFGPLAFRPSREEALLCATGDLALQGLWAPLVRYLDFRELLRCGADLAYVRTRAEALGLSRALHGACELTAWFFPEVAAEAEALKPHLGAVERAALEQVIDAARDPERLRHLRGTEQAARLLVAP
ncbi:MAG: nucleotidyltransferase family protein [Anaeromyxobacter sp.]|nr:nucleotidyltransferase family protein [Anaeromyxobacter sp.]MBL0278440.1 nucleotidyltransferase family protein [Anaeromyxobacter sp.]